MRDRTALAIVGFAFALRLAHVVTIRDYPLYDILPLDSDSYDQWARDIARGRLFRGAPFYQAPLYAYFLGALHAVTRGDLLLPRLANALFGAIQVALVMRLGSTLFDRKVGLLAGFLTAIYAPFLFEEGKVMKTALGLVLSTGTLTLLAETRRRADPTRMFIAAGVAGGAASLVRENFLLVMVAFVVAVAWRERRGPWKGRAAAALLLGWVVAILPATIHNFAASQEIIPITSQAGQNFYTGNFEGNPHGGYLVPDFVRRNPRFEESDFAKEATRRLGWKLKPGEVSAYWLKEGLCEVQEEPLRFVRGMGTKLGLLLNNFEIPDDEDLRFFKRYAPILRLPLLTFAPVAIFGLVGLIVHAIRRTLPYEIAVFVGVYALSVALFFVFARYRLPLVAPLAVLAAERILALVRASRAQQWKVLGVHAAACAVVALLVLRPIDEGTTFANSHLSVGIAMELHGKPQEALVEYEQGLALEPDHPKLLRRAARLISSRDPAADQTLHLLQRAYDADPTNTEIAFRLATSHAVRGDREAAVRLFEDVAARGCEASGLHANLAILYEQMGRKEDAARTAQRALDESPEDAEMEALLRRVSEPPAGTKPTEAPRRRDHPRARRRNRSRRWRECPALTAASRRPGSTRESMRLR